MGIKVFLPQSHTSTALIGNREEEGGRSEAKRMEWGQEGRADWRGEREREPWCQRLAQCLLVCISRWHLLPSRPLRCWFQGPLGHPAWSRHHGLSGKLPGDRPCHFEPLHPYCQLRYLAPRLPDILHNVWLPGQRSYKGVRPGPAAHSVSHQAGGDAELYGTCGTVGHSQHDHHLPRTITVGLQGEEEHDGLRLTSVYTGLFFYILCFLHFFWIFWCVCFLLGQCCDLTYIGPNLDGEWEWHVLMSLSTVGMHVKSFFISRISRQSLQSPLQGKCHSGWSTGNETGLSAVEGRVLGWG